MNGIEIYIDESGDFGPFSAHCPYYVVTMVFHEQIERLYERMKELEYRLQLLGLENHCIHSSPAIRGEDEYYGIDLSTRRKVIANLMAFISHGCFRYKCFFARKEGNCTEHSVIGELKSQIDPFITANYDKLAAYSEITVCYDKGQRQISRLISETLEERFSNIRVAKVLPIQSRLSQVADLACTMKRIVRRLEETGSLTKSESYFFGGEKNFRKNWIKSILKSEWK